MAALEEEALPEKLNMGVWKRVGKYALKRWPLLLVMVSAMLITTFYDSSFVPSMNKAAIDVLSDPSVVGKNVWDITINVSFLFGIKASLSFLSFIILFASFIVVRSLAIFVQFFVTNYVGMQIMTDLRRDTYRHVQELSFSYFDKTTSGWLIARMQNDTSSLGDILSNGVIAILWSLFSFFFTFATMFSQNWMLSLVVLASMPLLCIIVPVFERILLKAHRRARQAYSKFVGWLSECINGAKTIKTLAIEEEVSEEADAVTTEIRDKRWRARRIDSFLWPILNFIGTAMIAVIVAVGLNNLNSDLGSVNGDLITLGTIVIFIGFVQAIYDPLQALSETISEFMSSQAGAEKVMQLLDAKAEIVDRPEVIEKYGTPLQPKTKNYEKLEGMIDFENVVFDYGNGIEVIHPMNLHIEKGTSVAIVGETGSGKTTTVNLLCRFYQPTSGRILVDGADYLDRSIGWLRSNIGYVQQTPFVFNGTFAYNISYGSPTATMDDIVAAAKIVGIHDFIMSTEKGYDTVLEDFGGTLSQGQKQLISFARAIIRNPAILILDEATSSIDTETEAEVQNAINKLLVGRTSIVIAHRLSTIVGSDRILVMDHGTIVEDGNHKTLMEKKGAYYRLYMNQFNGLAIDAQVEAYQTQIEDKDIKL